MMKQGEDLIIGNVGDSRAVLATRDTDNILAAVQLTVDLKPNLPSITLSHPQAICILHALGVLCFYRRKQD